MADTTTINAKDVKDLRDKTGAGMMECKKALQETGGDVEKAIDWLRAKGAAKAAKRAEVIERYRGAFSNPYVAAGRRLVDAVIEPALTRRHLAQALEYLHTKRELRPGKKHGLMPL